ncbi:MAG: hypothetical protein ACLFV4_11340, partial [Candidatus Hydrogenedentota bacterium]
VIDNLERGLAEARARVAVLEPLAEAAASVNSYSPSDDDRGREEPKESQAPSVGAGIWMEKEGTNGGLEPEEVPVASENPSLRPPPVPAVRLMDTPFGVEMEATLDELSQGRAHARSGEEVEGQYEAARLLDARIELQPRRHEADAAKPENAGRSAEYSEAERHRRAVLRAAVQKLKKGAFASLSFEEAELALSCYTSLQTRLFLNERDARLKVILKQGLSGIAHYSERLAKRLEDAHYEP